MNQTTNYQLSQWESTDRILMEDFNSDNAKLDGLLAELEDRTATLESAAQGFGNCQLYFQTYTGNGATSRTFTFPKQPKLVMLRTSGYMTVASAGDTEAACFATNGAGGRGTASWSGTSVTLSFSGAQHLCNSPGYAGAVIALIAADA